MVEGDALCPRGCVIGVTIASFSSLEGESAHSLESNILMALGSILPAY